MNGPTTYEILVSGRASARFLRPLLGDFAVDHPSEGVTRLVGEIRDAAHLHGVVAHLTSVNVELISIGPRAVSASAGHRTDLPSTTNEKSIR